MKKRALRRRYGRSMNVRRWIAYDDALKRSRELVVRAGKTIDIGESRLSLRKAREELWRADAVIEEAIDLAGKR